MRYAALALTMLLAAPVTAADTPDQLTEIYYIHNTKHGDFAGVVIDAVGDAGKAFSMGGLCLVSGPSCALLKGADGGNDLFKYWGGPQDFHAFYHAPKGYTICRARIDWGHTGIDAHSTFATQIQRQPEFKEDGLSAYLVVPAARGHGTGIDSKIAIYFVKTGLAEKAGCWPTGVHPWDCKGHECDRIYPGARL